MTDITKLLDLLNDMIDDDTIQGVECDDGEMYLGCGISTDIPEILQDIENELCDLLIKGNSVDWGVVSELREYGYDVFPGETDSFGWLSGCFKTSKGIIVFG
ncbi:MAG: hypothetical protein ACRCXT_09485 [Paraclostridium sp.]